MEKKYKRSPLRIKVIRDSHPPLQSKEFFSCLFIYDPCLTPQDTGKTIDINKESYLHKYKTFGLNQKQNHERFSQSRHYYTIEKL